MDSYKQYWVSGRVRLFKSSSETSLTLSCHFNFVPIDQKYKKNQELRERFCLRLQKLFSPGVLFANNCEGLSSIAEITLSIRESR